MKTFKVLVIIVTVILIGHALYIAQGFIIPLVLGFLIALTLRPIAKKCETWSIPAPATAFVIIIILSGSIGLGTYSLSGPFSELVASAPRIGYQIERKFKPVQEKLKAVESASKSLEGIAKGDQRYNPQRVVVEQPALLTTAASSVASGVTNVLVALVFSLLLLSTGTLFYEKTLSVLPLMSDKKTALRLIYDIERQISRYLLTVTLINMSLGTLIGALFWLYGMENYILWGIMAACLNFLPFIGALIGIVLASGFAIVEFPTLLQASGVPLIYLLVTLVEGNFLTPMIVGRRFEMNIVAVFVAVVFWGWMWGVIGALMAVPILVVFKAFCDNLDSLHAIGEFLGARQSENKGND